MAIGDKYEVRSDNSIISQTTSFGSFVHKLNALFNVLGRCDPILNYKMSGRFDEGLPDFAIDRRNFPINWNKNCPGAALYVYSGSERTPVIVGCLDSKFEDPYGKHWEFARTQNFLYQADKNTRRKADVVYTVAGIIIPSLKDFSKGVGSIKDLPELQGILANSGKKDLINYLKRNRGSAPIEFFVQGEDSKKVTSQADFLLYDGLCNNSELFGLRRLEDSPQREMGDEIDGSSKYAPSKTG
jgi:hypothetical protein